MLTGALCVRSGIEVKEYIESSSLVLQMLLGKESEYSDPSNPSSSTEIQIVHKELILDGNSVIGAHVKSNLCYLIC